jgi:hypothetical protein
MHEEREEAAAVPRFAAGIGPRRTLTTSDRIDACSESCVLLDDLRAFDMRSSVIVITETSAS